MVLSWLGEATELAGDAFSMVSILAAEYDCISKRHPESLVPVSWSYGALRSPSDLFHGEKMEALSKQPCWKSLLEIYQNKYFHRLWIMQEIVLSSACTVLCGPYQISWDRFLKCAMLLDQYEFLTAGLSETSTIGRIVEYEGLKEVIQLQLLLHQTAHAEVGDPKDRIFALLGMLPVGPLEASIRVDYAKSLCEINQNACASLLWFEKSLTFLTFLDTCPSDRFVTHWPLWVPKFHNLHPSGGILPFKRLKSMPQSFDTSKPSHVLGDKLVLCGFVFDRVVDVTVNLTAENLEAQIQSSIKMPASTTSCSLSRKSLWQSISNFDDHDDIGRVYDFNVLQGFEDLLSSWDNATDTSLNEDALKFIREVKQCDQFRTKLGPQYFPNDRRVFWGWSSGGNRS
jgi:hypothetical protein